MSISHVNGVAASSLSHLNGVAKANVSAINGQTAGFGGAPPTFVAAGTFVGDNNAITPGLPAGTAQNDILVLFGHTNNTQAMTVSGWTEAPNSPLQEGTWGMRINIFWKRAGSSESAPTTNDSGDRQCAVILGFRGCITTGSPWDATTSQVDATTTSSIVIPTITTSLANTMIVGGVTGVNDADAANFFSSWANSNLTGLNERVDQSENTGTGAGASWGIFTGQALAAGAIGTTTATRGGGHTASHKIYWVGALKPA